MSKKIGDKVTTRSPYERIGGLTAVDKKLIELNKSTDDIARRVATNDYSLPANFSTKPVDVSAEYPEWGKSQYDEFATTKSQLLDLNETRALHQSAASKIGNSIAKGAITAGTTFVSTFTTIGGAIEALATWDASKIWDNKASVALAKFGEDLEKNFTNYTTHRHDDLDWYSLENLTSADFIGDSIIKNAGFIVGAAWGGGAVAKGLGFAAKALTKGLLAAKKVDTAVGVVEASKALRTIVGMPKATAMLTGSIISAATEASIEANQAVNPWAEKRKEELHDNYIINLEKIKDNPLLDVEQKRKEIENLNDITRKTEAKIEEDRKKLGNHILAVQTPLLSVENAFVFGKMYGSGFKSSRIVSNIINKGEKGVAKTSKSLTGKTAAKEVTEEAAQATKKLTPLETLAKDTHYATSRTKTKGALLGIGKSLSEGAEEVGQKTVNAIGEHYYTADVNEFYNSKVNPKAESQAISWLEAISKGTEETFSDAGTGEEFFIGAFMGGLGMPSFGVKTNSKGKKRLSVKMNGGIYSTIKDYNANMRRESEMADIMNETLQSPQTINLIHGLTRQLYYQQSMDEATKNNDKFAFKNSEAGQLLSIVNTFSNAGKLSDLRDMVEAAHDTSDENLEDILKQVTTSTEVNGKQQILSPFMDGDGNVMPKEQIKEKLDQAKNDLLDTITEYEKIKQGIDVTVGDQLSDDSLEYLTGIRLLANNYRKRAFSIATKSNTSLGEYNSEVSDNLDDVVKEVSNNFLEGKEDNTAITNEEDALDLVKLVSKYKQYDKIYKDYVNDPDKLEKEVRTINKENIQKELDEIEKERLAKADEATTLGEADEQSDLTDEDSDIELIKQMLDNSQEDSKTTHSQEVLDEVDRTSATLAANLYHSDYNLAVLSKLFESEEDQNRILSKVQELIAANQTTDEAGKQELQNKVKELLLSELDEISKTQNKQNEEKTNPDGTPIQANVTPVNTSKTNSVNKTGESNTDNNLQPEGTNEAAAELEASMELMDGKAIIRFIRQTLTSLLTEQIKDLKNNKQSGSLTLAVKKLKQFINKLRKETAKLDSIITKLYNTDALTDEEIASLHNEFNNIINNMLSLISPTILSPERCTQLEKVLSKAADLITKRGLDVIEENTVIAAEEEKGFIQKLLDKLDTIGNISEYIDNLMHSAEKVPTLLEQFVMDYREYISQLYDLEESAYNKVINGITKRTKLSKIKDRLYKEIVGRSRVYSSTNTDTITQAHDGYTSKIEKLEKLLNALVILKTENEQSEVNELLISDIKQILNTLGAKLGAINNTNERISILYIISKINSLLDNIDNIYKEKEVGIDNNTEEKQIEEGVKEESKEPQSKEPQSEEDKLKEEEILKQKEKERLEEEYREKKEAEEKEKTKSKKAKKVLDNTTNPIYKDLKLATAYKKFITKYIRDNFFKSLKEFKVLIEQKFNTSTSLQQFLEDVSMFTVEEALIWNSAIEYANKEFKEKEKKGKKTKGGIVKTPVVPTNSANIEKQNRVHARVPFPSLVLKLFNILNTNISEEESNVIAEYIAKIADEFSLIYNKKKTLLNSSLISDINNLRVFIYAINKAFPEELIEEILGAVNFTVDLGSSESDENLHLEDSDELEAETKSQLQEPSVDPIFGYRKWYPLAFSQYVIDKLKQGIFELFFDSEEGTYYSSFKEYYAEIFKNINEGKVKEGDVLTLKYSTINNYETVSLYTKDGLLVGTLPSESRAKNKKYLGLPELINKLKNGGTQTLTVNKLMLGQFTYTKDEVRSVKELLASSENQLKEVILGIKITKEPKLRTNSTIKEKIENIFNFEEETKNKGKVYILLPNSKGTLSPKPLIVSRFTKENVAKGIGTNRLVKIKELVNLMVNTKDTKGNDMEFTEQFVKLSQLLYLGKGEQGVHIRLESKTNGGVTTKFLSVTHPTNKYLNTTINLSSSEDTIEIDSDGKIANEATISTKFNEKAEEELLDWLFSLGVLFNVDSNKINQGNYNNELIEDNLLYTHLTSTKMTNSWFTTSFYDPNTDSEVNDIAPQFSTPLSSKINKEKGYPIQRRDKSYYVTKENEVYDNREHLLHVGDNGLTQDDLDLIIKLAQLHQLSEDNINVANGYNRYNNIIKVNGRYFDLKNNEELFTNNKKDKSKIEEFEEHYQDPLKLANLDDTVVQIKQDQQNVTKDADGNYIVVDEKGNSTVYKSASTIIGSNWENLDQKERSKRKAAQKNGTIIAQYVKDLINGKDVPVPPNMNPALVDRINNKIKELNKNNSEDIEILTDVVLFSDNILDADGNSIKVATTVDLLVVNKKDKTLTVHDIVTSNYNFKEVIRQADNNSGRTSLYTNDFTYTHRSKGQTRSNFEQVSIKIRTATTILDSKYYVKVGTPAVDLIKVDTNENDDTLIEDIKIEDSKKVMPIDKLPLTKDREVTSSSKINSLLPIPNSTNNIILDKNVNTKNTKTTENSPRTWDSLDAETQKLLTELGTTIEMFNSLSLEVQDNMLKCL